jgi:hypothetical protein
VHIVTADGRLDVLLDHHHDHHRRRHARRIDAGSAPGDGGFKEKKEEKERKKRRHRTWTWTCLQSERAIGLGGHGVGHHTRDRRTTAGCDTTQQHSAHDTRHTTHDTRHPQCECHPQEGKEQRRQVPS